MDKSFNDQELSDIMKEIEALEQDFIPSTEAVNESLTVEELATSSNSEVIASDTVPSGEFVAETELTEEFHESPSTTPQAEHVPEHTGSIDNVVALEHRPTFINTNEHRPAASTSMRFKVSGDLTLELAFDIGGQTVALEVTESGLSIEMEGGMKFTVPMKQKSELKKVV